MRADERTGKDRRGYYIRTFTGKKFYWERVADNEYDIRDIAHALSMKCRWGGHTKQFYSVAEHSVLVAWNVPPKHRLSALLHDAPEAYIADITSPLKWFLRDTGAEALTVLNDEIDAAICKTFKVLYPRPWCIKQADLRALATEHRDLMANGREKKFMPKPFPDSIAPLAPYPAEILFMNRYKDWHR